MKKCFLMAAALLPLVSVHAGAQGDDSVHVFHLQGVSVTATRAGARTPVAYTDVDGESLARLSGGRDVPFLLSMTPSVVATSDAGTGIGYTGIRVRGTDATRINVTANGIPMNDAESHGLFWVNTPDLASSLEDIQVQRGVGTSTNGAGAFGGSINMRTESLSSESHAEISGGYGSYNTRRESLKVSTGLMGGHWAFNARLSDIRSDGYVDRASADLRSYFAQGGYYARGTAVRLIVFGGREKTYHAWNGIDRDRLEENRRHNPCGAMEQVVRDGGGVPVRDPYGEPVTELAGFYADQNDNYAQRNYQLLVTRTLGRGWDLNVNFHYTDGYGYYEEYKNACTLSEYGLKAFFPADPSVEPWLDAAGVVDKSNLVRRKMMDNGFGGVVFSLDHSSQRLTASLGGGANRYDGYHFGRVIWVQNYMGGPDPGHEYYRNHSVKDDVNLYLKTDYALTPRLNVYVDLQYRYIDWTIKGPGDNWDRTWNDNQGRQQMLDVDETYGFFNPKAGLFWQAGPSHHAYASFAVARKEPTRNNFTDARFGNAPKAERLIDYELGYGYRGHNMNFGANFYYMDYKDQLVLTGQTNDIGEPMAENTGKSFRAGVELTAGLKIAPWLRWDGNATLSRNRIRDYVEYLDDYDGNWMPLYTQTPNHTGTTTISFSPSLTANSLFAAAWRGWEASLRTGYVSKQYMTNSEQDDVALDRYCVSDLRLSYTFAPRGMRSVTLGFAVNNIFNKKYCSNGWGGSSYVRDGGGGIERSNYAGFFPQATANVMADITMKF